jgi:protein SCO1/2
MDRVMEHSNGQAWARMLFVAICCGLCLWKTAPGFARLTQLIWQPALVLQTGDGPITADVLRGKVSLLYFGYTYCPDVCPMTLADVGQVLGKLQPKELAEAQAIFVSIDPERDTPAKLKEYTAYFHKQILGVTAAPLTLAALAARYGAHFEKHSTDTHGGYVMDHSTSMFVLDKRGNVVTTLAHGSSPERIAVALRAALHAAPNREGTHDAHDLPAADSPLCHRPQ